MMHKHNTRGFNPSRRDFLKHSGALAAGLTVAFHLPATLAAGKASKPAASDGFAPDAWIRILPDDTVKIIVSKYDSGTGTHTALPACVCEELDVEPESVQVEFPSEPFLEAYKHKWWGVWSTGGSTSIRLNYDLMREAGATARQMLLAAAAQQWAVPQASLSTDNGRVSHAASQRSASYGALANAAAQLPAPEKVTLKDPSAFRYIGKIARKRDVLAKATGQFKYSIDVKLPGMRVASIERAPVINDTVADFDASAALKVPGVRDVVLVPGRPDIRGGNQEGVAVLADDFWSAQQGRKALKVTWRGDSPMADFDSDQLHATQAAWLESDASPLVPTITAGDANAQWAGAKTVVDADYTGFYKAQNPLEPMCITAQMTGDGITFWGGMQVPSWTLEAAEQIAGVTKDKITLYNMVAGGSFGARENKYWLLEVAYLAKTTGQPIQLLNSREDEMRGLYYHSPTLHRLKGAVDDNAALLALHLRAVSPRSPEQWEPGYEDRPDHMDYSTTEALREAFPYTAPHMDIGWVPHETGIPTGWYRAVSFIPNVFAVEGFMGEMAHAAQRDPLAFRLAHMHDRPRQAGVLKAAAQRAGWGDELPANEAMGIAIDQGYGTYIAVVAKVRKTDGDVRVTHLTCAVDCGLAVSRKGVEEQIYGGLMWGMGHVLYDKLDIKQGQVVQSNFGGYQVPRMPDMPTVDIEIIEGDKANPTGIGELSNPLVPPAVANAVFRLTGKRLRAMPLALDKV